MHFHIHPFKSSFKRGLALNLNGFGRRAQGGISMAILPAWALLLFPEEVLEGLGRIE